jgi:hypothetical protein
MLTGKNVVIIKGEGSQYTAIPFDRQYLEYGLTDKLISVDTKVNKELCKLPDGTVFQKVVPEADITAIKDVPSLVQEAVNLCATDASTLANYKNIENAGWLWLLRCASDGRDLWQRAQIGRDNRPKAAVDPAVARAKYATAMIAEAASRGKVLTMEKALARIAKLEAMEAEEA